MKNIHKTIEKNIIIFTSEISEKFGMNQDELLEMWTSVSKMKIKTNPSKIEKKKTKSPWLQFCKDQRTIIKKENPKLPFGDISKLIGKKWKTMTTFLL
jgi:hypothetical protein